ncbi:hypothetical protein HYR69_06010 [Candidatus Sumerlaeota bacterium]|nr:hypothetical protein [Candidatus Sumerlaeota bacterium]
MKGTLRCERFTKSFLPLALDGAAEVAMAGGANLPARHPIPELIKIPNLISPSVTNHISKINLLTLAAGHCLLGQEL